MLPECRIAGHLGAVVLCLLAVEAAAQPGTTQAGQSDPAALSSSLENPHPLPADQAPTARETLGAARNAWFTRNIYEAYLKSGSRNPKWDLPSMDLLAATLKGDKTAKALDRGKEALDAGCDDAMVLFCYGSILQDVGKQKEAATFLRRAMDKFPKTSYSPFFIFSSAYRLRQCRGKQAKKKERHQLEDLMLSGIVASMKRGDFLPDEQRVLYTLMWDWKEEDAKASSTRQQRLYEAIRDLENIDPWLKNLLMGQHEITLAWDERGGGWANTVTPKHWEGFRLHLGKARRHLMAAWRINPHAPEAATEMITVAMTLIFPESGDVRTWFDRAVAAQLDYDLAYRRMFHALRPRWCGSYRQMIDFGLECAKTKRYDTRVPFHLYGCVKVISRDADDYTLAFRRPGVYAAIREMLEGYLQTPIDANTRAWNLSIEVAVAWRAKQWQDAKESLERVGESLVRIPFREMASYSPDVSISEIYYRNDPPAEAEEYLQRHEYTKAAESLHREIARAGNDDKRLLYMKDQAWRAERKVVLAEGKWVDLMPGKDLEGWRTKAGDWSMTDGVLEGKANVSGLDLICTLPSAARLEIIGRVEFVNIPYKYIQGGFFFTDPFQPPNFSVLLFPREKKVMCFSGRKRFRSKDDIVTGLTVDSQKINEFHLQLWDGRLSATVNGTAVSRSEMLDNTDPKAYRIGVGGSYWYVGPIIRFHEIKCRILTKQPSVTDPPINEFEYF